jgi:hypothetical protein
LRADSSGVGVGRGGAGSGNVQSSYSRAVIEHPALEEEEEWESAVDPVGIRGTHRLRMQGRGRCH